MTTELTGHVLDEVTLAWRVFGQEKCVFIVNDRGVRVSGDSSGIDSDASWRSWLEKTRQMRA